MNKCFCTYRWFYVLNFCEKSFLRLVKYTGMIGNFCLSFLWKIRDLYFCLLLYLHQVFFDFLNFSLVLSYLFIMFFFLQIFLLLNLFYVDIQIFFLLQQFAKQILILELMSYEWIELCSCIILDELDFVND